MSAAHILIIVIAGVTLLLLMVLKFKISAFISLLVSSMFVGILAGMPIHAAKRDASRLAPLRRSPGAGPG